MNRTTIIAASVFVLGTAVGVGITIVASGPDESPDLPPVATTQSPTAAAAADDPAPRVTLTPRASALPSPAHTPRPAEREQPRAAEAVPENAIFVPFEVLGPDGAPAERAEVVVEQQGKDTTHPWTPAKPTVPIAPGLYNVRAQTEGGLERSSSRALTVKDGGAPGVSLQLEARNGLAGRVDVPADEVDAKIYVWVLRLEASAALDPDQLRKDGDQKTIGDERTFRFLDLRPGTYAIGVGRGKKQVDASQTVEVGRQLARVNLSLPPLDTSRVLVVHAFGPDGGVLKDVKARAGCRTRDGETSKGKGRGAVTKSDGSLWISPSEEFLAVVNGSTRGEAYVRVSSERYGEKTIALANGSSLQVSVRFQGPAVLTIEVDGYVGSDMEGALKAELVRVEGSGESYGSRSKQGKKKKIDANGQEAFGPVQPGEYELVLLVKEDGDDRVASATPVRLEPGENQVRIALPQLGSLIVQVEIGTTKSVTLHRVGADNKSYRKEKPDDDGRVVFDRLQPGSYQLELWGDDGASFMAVDVNGPTRVEFEGESANALRVRVSDSDGALARAGLLDGDALIGLDGAVFEGTSHMRSLFDAAGGGAHKLTVLRGDARLELSVDDLSEVLKPKRLNSPKKLLKPAKGAGGSFELTRVSG